MCASLQGSQESQKGGAVGFRRFSGIGTFFLLLFLIVAVISIIYLVQRFFIFRHSGQAVQFAAPEVSITDRDFVYDLSGSEGSGYGDPMKLFDGDSSSNPLPYRNVSNYFPAGKGHRIVVDFKDLVDVEGFSVYDHSYSNDSIWLYSGEMKSWSLMTGYRSAGSPAGWGWKNFRHPVRTRFIMLRLNGPGANFTELKIYGKDVRTRPHYIMGPFPANSSFKTLFEFGGTNVYDYVPDSLLKPFHNVRMYQMLSWYDADTLRP